MNHLKNGEVKIVKLIVSQFYRVTIGVVYRATIGVIYRASIVLVRQSQHEEIATRIENRLLVSPFIRLEDSGDAGAEVLDVMQLA